AASSEIDCEAEIIDVEFAGLGFVEDTENGNRLQKFWRHFVVEILLVAGAESCYTTDSRGDVPSRGSRSDGWRGCRCAPSSAAVFRFVTLLGGTIVWRAPPPILRGEFAASVLPWSSCWWSWRSSVCSSRCSC